MKLTFHPSEYYSDMEGFKVCRGRGFRWVAAMREGANGWVVLADDCASAEDAMNVCTEHLRRWSEAPANDVEF